MKSKDEINKRLDSFFLTDLSFQNWFKFNKEAM